MLEQAISKIQNLANKALRPEILTIPGEPGDTPVKVVRGSYGHE